MMIWVLIFLMGVITFSVRYVFFAQTIRYQIGPRMKLLLRYSSFSILTALWTPIVFNYQPSNGLSVVGFDYLIAASVAALLALLRVSTLLVVLISSVLFFVLRFGL